MRSSACWVAPLWLDSHSVWFSFHLLLHSLISMKLSQFSFNLQFVVFPVLVFLISHWYLSSRSLVGQRWCLTWGSVMFIWLQCDMRSSACWIATLWHDTYAVWDSSAFRDCFISFFLDRCRLLFVWLVCPSTGPRVLGITVVLYF